jgi:hypothetical protein
VDNGIVSFEPLRQMLIGDIAFDEASAFGNEVAPAIRQIIDDGNFVTRRQEGTGSMATDETGAAGKKYTHGILIMPYA